MYTDELFHGFKSMASFFIIKQFPETFDGMRLHLSE